MWKAKQRIFPEDLGGKDLRRVLKKEGKKEPTDGQELRGKVSQKSVGFGSYQRPWGGGGWGPCLNGHGHLEQGNAGSCGAGEQLSGFS